MPDCRYVVLNYHLTETSTIGHPLVLLFEYLEESGRRQRSNYLLSDFNKVVSDTPVNVREWLTSVLTDLGLKEFHPDLDTEEMFSLYSFLNVGPLRTAHTGHFACESLDKALEVVRGNIKCEGRSAGGDDPCLSDFLVPLNEVTAKSIRKR